jgi:hypothetical protein
VIDKRAEQIEALDWKLDAHMPNNSLSTGVDGFRIKVCLAFKFKSSSDVVDLSM